MTDTIKMTNEMLIALQAVENMRPKRGKLTLVIDNTTGEVEMKNPERLLISGSMEAASVKYRYGWREFGFLFCASILGLCVAKILAGIMA